MNEKLTTIAELSRFYGSDSRYVFLGGGNTSVKDGGLLFIKPSGVALATIQAEDFLAVDRNELNKLFSFPLPQVPEDALGDQGRLIIKTREAIAKNFLGAAVRPAGAGRPSVETPVHEVFGWTYVVHLHPSFVNGMTCAVNGKAACQELFPDALWIDYCDPGLTLSLTVKDALDDYLKAHGAFPHAFFLGNHGVFVGADSADEIKAIYADIEAKLNARYAQAGIDCGEKAVEPLGDDDVLANAPRLRTLLMPSAKARAAVAAIGKCPVFAGPLTPDHVVYAKSFAYRGPCSSEGISQFKAQYGYLPKVVEIEGVGAFAAADTLKAAQGAATALKNALLVERLTQAFGGPSYLNERQYKFIENWEAESYRRSVASSSSNKRLAGKVCVVTGGAQGFGLGIAQYLAANGAFLVLADMNLDGATKAAKALNGTYGDGCALAVAVNISDEDSVQAMVAEIVRACGGIDLLVANAGVVRAGSVMEISKKDWDFVTNINYTGYFLCCKHCSKVMARQIVDGTGLWSDIVQVNSKSGLEGSNKNGAYAGSKFGTIGLTQSFAKELVTSCIKVNSVCPGNYYDGPLWSDPVKGLFKVYLEAGKVPGAQTVADVRRFYEDKVPMRRGCTPPDVAKAIIYCVEQDYETGQAIPVTGGQVMLH